MTLAQTQGFARIDWRGWDRAFFMLLAVSVLTHFGALGLVLRDATPLPEVEDQPQDRIARAMQLPAKTLHQAPPVAIHAETPRAPKAVALHGDALRTKVARIGLITAINEDGSGLFADPLANGHADTSLEDALRGANGTQLAGPDALGMHQGAGMGDVASIPDLGTDGAKHVALGPAVGPHVHGHVAAEPVEPDSPPLDRDALGRYVKSQSRAIQECYERELKVSPTLHGKLAVRLTLSTVGRVLASSIEEDTLQRPAVASCVQSRMHFWHFPVKLTEEGAAQFTFNFVPAG